MNAEMHAIKAEALTEMLDAKLEGVGKINRASREVDHLRDHAVSKIEGALERALQKIVLATEEAVLEIRAAKGDGA